MYYCTDCGVVRFLNRVENNDKPTRPRLELDCRYCEGITVYRKILPENIGAANRKGTQEVIKKIYEKLSVEIQKLKDQIRDLENLSDVQNLEFDMEDDEWD